MFTSPSLFILSLPCFLPLTSFPLPGPAACHSHMPGSSVSGPAAPLGHERKLMPAVSLEPAATSLGATVAPDLLSANNPRPGKAKGALGSVARGSCPGLGLQVGAQLVAASRPSPLHPPGNLRQKQQPRRLSVYQLLVPEDRSGGLREGTSPLIEPPGLAPGPQTSVCTVGCFPVQDLENLRPTFLVIWLGQGGDLRLWE